MVFLIVSNGEKTHSEEKLKGKTVNFRLPPAS